MPSMDFDVTKMKESIFDRDVFRPDGGDTCRILLLSHGAEWHYCHWVRNGKIIEKGPNAGQQGGDYIQCLGNIDVLTKDQRDPDGCPLCGAAEPGRDVRISFPSRRFVSVICQYFTDKKGDLIDPRHPTFAVKMWKFGDPIYTQLAKLSKEFGKLWERDLIVSVGTDSYKKQTVTPGNDAIIMRAVPGSDGKSKAAFGTALLSYRAALKDMPSEADLLLLCGQPKSYEALEREVEGALPRTIRENDAEVSIPALDLDVMIGEASPQTAAMPTSVEDLATDDDDVSEEDEEVNMDDLLKETEPSKA